MVDVVPVVLPPDSLAILALSGKAEVDQRPGQPAAEPCPPPKGMPWTPNHARPSTLAVQLHSRQPANSDTRRTSGDAANASHQPRAALRPVGPMRTLAHQFHCAGASIF